MSATTCAMSDAVTRLSDLGSTPDRVAQTLFEAGVRGYPGSSVACPVAKWLNQVSPDGEWIVSSSESHCVGSGPAVLINPPPVSAFVDLFDGGKYTDLYPDDYDHALFLAGV